MKIAFFGTPRLAQIVLEKLIESPYRPDFVVTAPHSQTGRTAQKYSLVWETANSNKIEVLQPGSVNNLRLEVGKKEFDLAILIAYGKIIPKDILAIPKFGFINIHPSLLPQYRGPSPVQSAILAGDKKTGVTIILLDEDVDHGPILAKEEVKIEKDDTHVSLNEKLAKLGAETLIDTLPDYLEGRLKPKPQDHTKAAFTKHIDKQEGYIDPDKPPRPEILERMVRAFYPWPGAWTKVDGKIIKFLPGGLIQPEGKRVMSKKELLNGYPWARDLVENLGI